MPLTNNIQIREYTGNDRHAVRALLAANTPQYFSPDEAKDLEDYLDNHIDQYFIIEANGEVAGCGGINIRDNVGCISWDMLHPSYQRHGLGTMLLQHRIDKLKAMGNITSIIVRTSQMTYQFYERGGFKLTQQVADYWAPGYDLYLMEYAG